MKAIQTRPLFVLAHNIRSLHNVGSIFRTADAFGVQKLFLTGITGVPPDPKISKVALGAEDFIPWAFYRSINQVVRHLYTLYPDLVIVGLENNLQGSSKPIALQTFRNLSKPLLLVLGEETRGMSKAVLKQCHVLLEIPMLGQKESLNVSIACGIALFWLRFGL